MASSLFGPNEIYIGRDFGGYEFEITPHAIENYIAATGDDHPWYRGASPLGRSLAPALVLHSVVFRNHDWYLPNIFGNLHARQQWEGFAPICAGDRLHSRSFITDRYQKRDREYVVNEVLIFDHEGRIVQRSRTHQSFLIGQDAAGGLAVDRSREKSSARVFEVGTRGGETLSAPRRTVSQAMCMAFSGPGRNYHTDSEEARKLGFPDIVVQGMLSVCLIAEMMTKRFGLGFMIGGRFDLRLVNVLWAEETTAPHGRVLERNREGDRTRAEVEVWTEKADGTKTIVGTASALEF
ncbi:MAG TPA: MaoC family dehydratase N-terminal domain-containing protein [Candidatus Binataceae bacterium]|nr:MaoC family dehydratase N-terminal domain-containing protein [Candidatus Binataceae bacterium]